MRIAIPAEILPASDLGHVHFVGLGGAGLSAIARIMLERGLRVSGSDAHDSPLLQALVSSGARCSIGHDAANVHGADTVIASTAVRESNPEIVEAQRLGLRIYPRSAGLQSVLIGTETIAVAGTHGKTTTTAMLTMALTAAGADPSYAIGAEVDGLPANAHQGGGAVFVAEADESDGAFLVYRPSGAIVTNVDADHLDNYGSVEAYHAAFVEFLGRIEPGGFLVVCTDDAGGGALAAAARDRGIRTISVGVDSGTDLRATDIEVTSAGTTFVVESGPRVLGSIRLRVPGRHYAVDALAALAAGLERGASFDALSSGLGDYAGARRRMEHLGTAGGVDVYDSYAHHPVEIAGDLQAARAVAGDRRLLVCFQPHLVSRTREFGAQMGAALGAADEVVVAELYVAREDPDPAVTSAVVLQHVALPAELVHLGRPLVDLPAQLVALAGPDSVLLTLGAGDIAEVGPIVLRLLEQRS